MSLGVLFLLCGKEEILRSGSVFKPFVSKILVRQELLYYYYLFFFFLIHSIIDKESECTKKVANCNSHHELFVSGFYLQSF